MAKDSSPEEGGRERQRNKDGSAQPGTFRTLSHSSGRDINAQLQPSGHTRAWTRPGLEGSGAGPGGTEFPQSLSYVKDENFSEISVAAPAALSHIVILPISPLKIRIKRSVPGPSPCSPGLLRPEGRCDPTLSILSTQREGGSPGPPQPPLLPLPPPRPHPRTPLAETPLSPPPPAPAPSAPQPRQPPD